MPAYARRSRMIALQHGAAVDIALLRSAVPPQEVIEHGQFLLDQLMIIITPGISRDATDSGARAGRAVAWRTRLGRYVFGIYGRHIRRCSVPLKIIERENNHCFRSRQDPLRIASLFGIAREVIHFTALAAIQP